MAEKFHSFSVKDAEGKDLSLSEFKDQTVLVVNVASRCGYTPQYTGLEELYRKYKSKGFTILAFPCNQFGAQEPGSNEEIQTFCSSKYDVTFPVMSKVDVNGPKTDPLFKFLKEKSPGILGTEMIKWNFTKFLVNKKGEVLKRYAPNVEPIDIAPDIEPIL